MSAFGVRPAVFCPVCCRGAARIAYDPETRIFSFVHLWGAREVLHQERDRVKK